MRSLHTVLGLSSLLALAGATLFAPTASSAATVERSYVACNSDGACWRVNKIYAYGEKTPITYHKSDWYAAHQHDEHVHWVADPDDDRGYYDHDRHWHPDPAARAVEGGAVGAGIGATIGCIVTLPVGCAPGAAVGAAVGGGAGAVTGAASKPE
jgi:hypothetical protein